MISVCMATYNGARWIDVQLGSILKQLAPDDEVVIVDDGSSDGTLDKIAAFDDKRIRILRNESNRGVDPTFERALGEARGDIIFLSDQDDVWYPNKVETVLQTFRKHPDVTLVLSDARIIDGDGNVVGPSYFADRGPFIPGVFSNILKSKFLGCAIAMKSSVRDKALPFPGPIPGHDMWLGVVNEWYGRTRFLPEPLIGYRRHGSNASPSRRQGIVKMIVWRWQLVFGLTKLNFRNLGGSSAKGGKH